MLVRYILLLFFFLPICNIRPSGVPENKQVAFEWVFGDLVRLDSQMVQNVLSAEPGKRHYVDKDGDGKPEEVWFIDLSPRHTQSKRPLLVRAIDEDGDLVMGGEPDTDSDLYVVDWNADGTVDSVLDYEDLDGDQDTDRMGIYFYDEKYGLRVWWSRDDGDDNLLWYDVNYTYVQQSCETQSHFGGDESFLSFHITPGEKRWSPFFENPFLFFDRDKDGVAEEVIRVLGSDNKINSLRWSFDADNDATVEQPRDFDVSISAYAGGWTLQKNQSEHQHQDWSTLTFKENQGEQLLIRGLPAGPILRRNTATSFLEQVTWGRVLMTWDENDLNIAWTPANNTYTIERWEGVIAASPTESGYEMPGIGWPDCGPYNKRYELLLHPKGPNEYYFHPADRRIHLKNSDKTWISVDYDNDAKVDMYYLWLDTDGDGVVDKISVDTDGDGRVDDSWELDTVGVQSVKYNFQHLNAMHGPVVAGEPRRLYLLNRVLAAAIQAVTRQPDREPVWTMIEHKMQNGYSEELANRLLNSDETTLYYLSLACDRRIARLKRSYRHKTFWQEFATLRSRGQTDELYRLLSRNFHVSSTDDYFLWLEQLRKQPAKKLVAWDNTWLPPNWGWESEQAAFRCYDGHFDLFGKRRETLIFPIISNGNSYHQDDNGWGMDILHVGKTGGCGGLVLYVDGIAYPLRDEKNPGDPVFVAKLFKETADSVTIEFTVTGVGPKDSPYTVTIRPSAVAGRRDSPIEVCVEGGQASRQLALGLVLNKLSVEDFFLDKEKGIMGLWGYQEPVIGWIGTGIVFPPDRFLYVDDQPEEHRIVLNYTPGETLQYHIQGDWLRGHRFCVAPGMKEWLNTLKETAIKANLK